MTNNNLTAARSAKKDCFFTQLSDIQAELEYYADKFKNETVFCNCDDPFASNFVKYFLMNFNRLGLKELIATGYRVDNDSTVYALRVKSTCECLSQGQVDLDMKGVESFLKTKNTGSTLIPLTGNVALDENGEPIQITIRVPVLDDNGNKVLLKSGKPKTKSVKKLLYYEAGDFRSDMSLALLQEITIAITNPPFSLFREFISKLIEFKKQFLIIGNLNAITYKEIFPLIKNGTMWFGNSFNKTFDFTIPSSYDIKGDGFVDGNSREHCRVSAICWYTNIDHPNRHTMLPLDLKYAYKGHEDMYPQYDNYDAINVDKISQIPSDYMGVMGVPITFLGKFCPEQFEIIGLGTSRALYTPTKHYINPKKYFQNGRIVAANEINSTLTYPISKDKIKNVYYTADNISGFLFQPYARILIKRKIPIHREPIR